MSTVRTHFQKYHQVASEHHQGMAEEHTTLAKSHKALAKAFEDNDISEAHNKLSDSHAELARRHSEFADFHASQAEKCMKSADSSEGFTETDLNKIVPDSIRGVIPSNPNRPGVVAVPRVGQPQELVNKSNTPTEFEHLLAID